MIIASAMMCVILHKKTRPEQETWFKFQVITANHKTTFRTTRQVELGLCLMRLNPLKCAFLSIYLFSFQCNWASSRFPSITASNIWTPRLSTEAQMKTAWRQADSVDQKYTRADLHSLGKSTCTGHGHRTREVVFIRCRLIWAERRVGVGGLSGTLMFLSIS